MDVKLTEIINLLDHWLYHQLEQESREWLKQKGNELHMTHQSRCLFVLLVPYLAISVKELLLLPQDWQAIRTIRSGWNPSHWSIKQVARTLILLSFPHKNQNFYLQVIEKLFVTANLEELITLYQTLPLLPYPEHFRLQAAEGVRSNMTAVFNAVALCNPYPAEYFDNIAWNQMVLKALFVGSSLDLIQGLDKRANPTLMQMLLDYAQERQSAKRSVPLQLWRLVETCFAQ